MLFLLLITPRGGVRSSSLPARCTSAWRDCIMMVGTSFAANAHKCWKTNVLAHDAGAEGRGPPREEKRRQRQRRSHSPAVGGRSRSLGCLQPRRPDGAKRVPFPHPVDPVPCTARQQARPHSRRLLWSVPPGASPAPARPASHCVALPTAPPPAHQRNCDGSQKTRGRSSELRLARR